MNKNNLYRNSFKEGVLIMIAIIADDLTGANDTGVQYVKNGYSTTVKIVNDGEVTSKMFSSSDVVVINTDTRPLPSKEAYDKVYTLAKKLGELKNVEYIYKKVDSLMRGNPAPELEAIMDATETKIAIVATAFPENGRFVTNGILKISDEKNVDIANIFNTETKRKAVSIHLDKIREGAEGIKMYIEKQVENGTSIFVFDTVSNEDLAIISEASMLLGENKIAFCGSAGLAKQLGKNKKASDKHDDNVFIIVGSRNEKTSKQVKMAKEEFDCPIVIVSSNDIIEGRSEKAINDSVLEAKKLNEEGNKLVMVVIDSMFEDFNVVLRETEEDTQKSLKIAKSLGIIAKKIFENITPVTLVATGGDTAFNVCDALGSDGIELTDEIVPGVPVGILKEGMADGTRMVTKSGGFGEEDTLVKVYNYLIEK